MLIHIPQVTRARLLTHLRSSRFLSPEDLIFLIRDDRGKVNRLRTYLSWKDVRKRAKEDEEGNDVDVEEAGQCPSSHLPSFESRMVLEVGLMRWIDLQIKPHRKDERRCRNYLGSS